MGNPYVAKLLAGPGDALITEIMNIAVEQREEAERVAKENDNPNGSCTFLMRLLRNKAENPSSITDREINSHTFGNITAGMEVRYKEESMMLTYAPGGDTTATALRAVLYYLISHQTVLQRLRSELRKAGVDKTGPIVSYSHASRVPYLWAVIREAMRLHPSVGMIIARTVPEGGVTLASTLGDTHHIGAGVEIGVNPWILHRDPEIFPDPEAYKPERWLDVEPEHLARMNKSWMPFGGGRHVCSGQHISMLEINKLIPSLVLRYDMKWADANGTVVVENYFFTAQGKMNLRLTHVRP